MKKNKELLSVHCSYFGDNFGDTLFAVEMVRFLLNQGIERDSIVLPFSSTRALEQSGVHKSGLLNFLVSKKVIFAGGGYFGEPESKKLLWNLRFLKRHGLVILGSLLLNKKIIVSGVGVGPISLRFNRYLIRKLFNKASKVIVRDPESFLYCKDVLKITNCKLGSDPIISTAIEKKVQSQVSQQKTIGVHLPMLKDSDELYAMAKELSVLQKNNDINYIVFLDFYKPSFNNIIEHHLNEKNVKFDKFSYDGTSSLEVLLSKLDGVITTKLHVGIVSTSLSIPAFSLYVHSKTPKYYKLIEKSSWCKKFTDYQYGDFGSFFDSVLDGERVCIPKDVVNKSLVNYVEISSWLKK